jgi:hypothetical protein
MFVSYETDEARNYCAHRADPCNKVSSRERPSRNADALAAQQARCVAICASYGKQLGLDFAQVRAGNEREFARVVGQMLQK